jgi:hypothetical protein
MVTFYKNKFLTENLFSMKFGANLLNGGDPLPPFKIGQALSIGFIRDESD